MNTPDRSDVRFDSGEEQCGAWLYMPDTAADDGPVPIVVLAHGIAGVKELRLYAFAERFRDAGYACLVFDYRHFGASSGQPRELIDIDRQLEDWRNAVTYARSLPDIDPNRVVVWGTSFGGGNVMITAADDPRIVAAITQCPFTDGPSSVLRISPRTSFALMVKALRDRASVRSGRSPVRIPATGRPGTAAMMTAPDSLAGFHALLLASNMPDMPQDVPARLMLRIPFHIPGRRARDIKCPIMFGLCEHDTIAPVRAAIRHARNAPRGEIRLYDAGHFDIYIGDLFEEVVSDQIEFLQRHVPTNQGSSNISLNHSEGTNR
ncbi:MULTISPECIES: alpha/beta hydrolase [Nocardiaceae]|uniref:alpha/beta hydrolase n=1 Tax=Nocardiaceae TaxID=85025 RepID=UPI0009B83C20|nr:MULTISPECIES: alpha/beta hydrolase [Rhodococcus]